MTLGQLAPTPAGTSSGVDFAQLAVSSGNTYTVPENGTITSWSTNAIAGSGQTLTMKVLRKVSDPAFYRAVGHDGPRNLTGGLLNTFATSIPVQTGDIIGLNGGNANTINTGTSNDIFVSKAPPGLNDGEAASLNTGSGGRINVSAVFVPNNTVTVGTTALNKKNGTATLNFTLPNPGDLTGTGNGVSAASAGNAVISKSVGAGAAQLLVKATGKKKKKLRQTGKVTLNVAITYTPTNGDPATQSVNVKLKKN